MNVRKFLFCIRLRGIKNRILSCLLIFSVILTFWLVRQEVEKTQRGDLKDKQSRDVQPVILNACKVDALDGLMIF